MSRYVIMTDEQWVEKMIKLARGKSLYRAEFPWNLLFYSAAENRFWGDCVNIQKALLNGRDVDNPVDGSYAWPLPATGDATEYALLMQCADISTEFSKLKAGDPRVIYMDGHIGAYLGREWEEPGQGIVNCVECTPIWEDGIQFSYVAADGARSWCKGGQIRGYWKAHGLASKWIEYTDEETQAIIEKDIAEVSPEVHTQHYGTVDLAVAFIRNMFGNGYNNRLNNCVALGYTEAEVRAAQDKTNDIVRKANAAKMASERQLVIDTAAYDVIAGKYGDGKARKDALIEAFGAELQPVIQARAEEWL